MITNLTDRIQNFLYDGKGEPWCKVGSVQNPGHTVEMQQPTLGNSQNEKTFTKEDTSNSGHIDSLSTEIQPKLKRGDVQFDVLLMHDSICHAIDIKRLLDGSGKQGTKQTTYTIESAASEILR